MKRADSPCGRQPHYSAPRHSDLCRWRIRCRLRQQRRCRDPKFEEMRPDLVLADIYMPGKNGYEVCAAGQEASGTRRILLSSCSRVRSTLLTMRPQARSAQQRTSPSRLNPRRSSNLVASLLPKRRARASAALPWPPAVPAGKTLRAGVRNSHSAFTALQRCPAGPVGPTRITPLSFRRHTAPQRQVAAADARTCLGLEVICSDFRTC